MIRRLLPVFLLFVVCVSSASAQCVSCQMQNQQAMPSEVWIDQEVTTHTPMTMWVEQTMVVPQRYTRARTETISAQCIGAAIDAFIAAGGFNNWSVALPAAFDAYQVCDGGGAMTARSRRMVRREIFRQVLKRRSGRNGPMAKARVRLIERVRLTLTGTSEGRIQRFLSRFRNREGGLFSRFRNRRSGGGMSDDHGSMQSMH